MRDKNRNNLVKLGRTLFPTRDHWDIEELEAGGLPLYWNKEWLKVQLDKIGSTYLIAEQWNYPWGELKRLANHFGLTTPTHRPLTGKFFLLDKELLKQIEEVKPPQQSRNRWIVEALRSYFAEIDQEAQTSASAASEKQMRRRTN